MIVEREQLVSEWTALGAREVRPCRDNRVFCPSLKWLDNFEKYLGNMVLPRGKQEAEKVDCDDFAIEVVAEAGRALRGNKLLKSCGHSIGMAEVIISPLGEGFLGLTQMTYDTHLTNVMRHPKGWVFYEGQTGLRGDVKTILDSGSISSILWVWL